MSDYTNGKTWGDFFLGVILALVMAESAIASVGRTTQRFGDLIWCGVFSAASAILFIIAIMDLIALLAKGGEEPYLYDIVDPRLVEQYRNNFNAELAMTSPQNGGADAS